MTNFIPPKQRYPHPSEKQQKITNYTEVEKISEKKWCPDCGARMTKNIRWTCPQCGCERC